MSDGVRRKAARIHCACCGVLFVAAFDQAMTEFRRRQRWNAAPPEMRCANGTDHDWEAIPGTEVYL